MSVQKDLTTVRDLIDVLQKKRGSDFAIDALLDVLPRLLDALNPSDVTSNEDIEALSEWMHERANMCGNAVLFLGAFREHAKHREAIQYLRGGERAWEEAADKVRNLNVIPF